MDTPVAMLLFVSGLLFFYGVRLSSYFSGSETGFYRVSTLQVTLEKQRGDRVASSLFYFVTHPERFVATTLVGNNVANYLTTLAVGLVVGEFWTSTSGAPEVISTLMLTPLVFIFGELIPKSLYYRAPMSLLRNGSVGFRFCYYLFLPISYPMILLSRLIARLSDSERSSLDVVFGRNRLYGVLEAGQREGLLTEIQRRLAENLMQSATRPVDDMVSPDATVIGVSEDASSEQVLSAARSGDSAWVFVHADGQPDQWMGVIRVADMLASGMAPRLVMRELPVFVSGQPVPEVLTQMCKQYAPFGVLRMDDRVIAIIDRQQMVSRLLRVMRPAQQTTEPMPVDTA
ncbi:MAG TPA: hypothetical protein DCG12_16660 [Planctomycetaceae bacterium]|nr:hypothetical protein [Planctomycetaceae bacterium]